MKGVISYLNDIDRKCEEEFLMEQYSGAPEELSDRMKELLFTLGVNKDDLTTGDWITIIDGELLDEPNEFHPFRIHITND